MSKCDKYTVDVSVNQKCEYSLKKTKDSIFRLYDSMCFEGVFLTQSPPYR